MRMILLLFCIVNNRGSFSGGGHWADVHVSAVKLEAKVVDSVAGSLANSTLTFAPSQLLFWHANPLFWRFFFRR